MEKVVFGKGVLSAGMSSTASHLVYYVVWRANLSKLS